MSFQILKLHILVKGFVFEIHKAFPYLEVITQSNEQHIILAHQ